MSVSTSLDLKKKDLKSKRIIAALKKENLKLQTVIVKQKAKEYSYKNEIKCLDKIIKKRNHSLPANNRGEIKIRDIGKCNFFK
jgi:hypothetical protein